jgi:hypothetical protein
MDWKGIVMLEDRVARHRVDLISPSGRKRLSLRYDLAGFESALALVLARAAVGPVHSYRTAGSDKTWVLVAGFTAAMSAMSAMSVWLVLTQKRWVGLIGLVAALSLPVLAWFETEVAIGETELTLRARGRARSVPFAELSDLRVELHKVGSYGQRHLVACVTHGRETIEVSRGRGAILAFLRLRDLLPQRAGR